MPPDKREAQAELTVGQRDAESRSKCHAAGLAE